MTTTFQPGEVLTAQKLNQAFTEKVDAANAQITGGSITGLASLEVDGLTDSTAPTNGAVIVVGGVGIGKSLQVGGVVTVGEDIIVNGTDDSLSPTTGAIVVVGGLGIGKNVNIGGSVDVAGSVSADQFDATGTMDTTGPGTGAVIVAGGMSVAKTLIASAVSVLTSLNVGDDLDVDGVTTSGGFVLSSGDIEFADGSTQSSAGVVEGVLLIPTTGGTVVITTAQAKANSIFRVTGVLTSNVTLEFPGTPKSFTVQNLTTGLFNVTATVAGQAPSASVFQGAAETLFTDATGCYATSAAAGGLGFSGVFPDATGLTIGISQLGGYVYQTASGIATKLPLATTFPAGKGVAIANRSAASNTITNQGADTTDLPAAILPGDVFLAISDGISHWYVGWYSASNTPRVTAIDFADGTSQTTANSVSAPTQTSYSPSIGNATIGASTITTGGYVWPFVEVYKNGQRLTKGAAVGIDVNVAPDPDGITLHLNAAVGDIDGFDVLTNVVYTPSTMYQVTNGGSVPPSGQTFFPVPHVVGFGFIMSNGVQLQKVLGDYTEDATGFTLAVPTDGFEAITWNIFTPITVANMARSGANSDITSLSALTTPLSIAQGGTGSSLGAGRTLLQTQQAVAASAQVTFTGLTADYDEYEFVITGLHATVQAQLVVQLSEDNGATWLTGTNYFYAGMFATTAAVSAQGAESTSLFGITGTTQSNGGQFDGVFKLFNAGSTSRFKTFLSDMVGFLSDNHIYNMRMSGSCAVLPAVNAIRFIYVTSTMASGTISMYGINK